MKLQEDAISKLEKCVDELTKYNNAIPEDRQNQPTMEDAAIISYLLGFIFALGWMLGEEEALQQLAVKFRVAALVKKLTEDK